MPGGNIRIDKLKAVSHEGHWEHIDVRWEKINNNWTMRDVFFARHQQKKGELVPKSKLQLVNDQMKWDKNGTHPIVYVAMNSHGTYPKNIFFLIKNVDKTSNHGPVAFLYGKDTLGKWKLEDYQRQPWSNYIFRWGADITKRFGGSPETPHAYGSFIKGKRTPAKLIVNNKPVCKLEIKNGSSPYFKIDPRTRIKEIDFRVAGPHIPASVDFEVWQKGFLGLRNKKLFGPFKLKPKHITEEKLFCDDNITDPVPANYKDTLYITGPTSLSFTIEVKLVE